jgi:hypothetical protein
MYSIRIVTPQPILVSFRFVHAYSRQFNSYPVKPGQANVLYTFVFVTCLLKARIVEPEKQPLIGNGRVIRNNGITVGGGFVGGPCR